jgi:uncharacterized protein YdiU (UPF0061 family)
MKSLNWVSRFLDETPGDSEVGGKPRQVLGACWSRVEPTPTPKPVLRLWSYKMAEELGVDYGGDEILGGKDILDGMDCYAQRYGGHQFGNWAGQLGDGRAITLGEVDTGSKVFDIQLKGSGVTPYSRFADGKAVLRSSIREFICSEAMYYLGIPTTRVLSMVTTGEDVVRDVLYNGNPAPEPGAIVCRVAESFIRFGSFQIHAITGDIETLRSLVEYTVKHHFPEHNIETDESIIEWLKQIADETALMIAHWMRVGFVHGVMNTDNMSIHGLTIDYGPYGWIEDYDLGWTPNTTDAGRKRYRFGNQAQIGAWNFARLLESIGPLMSDPEMLYQALDFYYESYEKYSNSMWADKLGIEVLKKSDDELIKEMTSLLQSTETDMTIFFRLLSSIDTPDIEHLKFAFYKVDEIPVEQWNDWLNKWWKRADSNPDKTKMNKANPKYVLRNWMAQLAIDAAEKEDYTIAEELCKLLENPYDDQPDFEEKWFQKRPEWARDRVGCSMLSCSS